MDVKLGFITARCMRSAIRGLMEDNLLCLRRAQYRFPNTVLIVGVASEREAKLKTVHVGHGSFVYITVNPAVLSHSCAFLWLRM